MAGEGEHAWRDQETAFACVTLRAADPLVEEIGREACVQVEEKFVVVVAADACAGPVAARGVGSTDAALAGLIAEIGRTCDD